MLRGIWWILTLSLRLHFRSPTHAPFACCLLLGSGLIGMELRPHGLTNIN